MLNHTKHCLRLGPQDPLYDLEECSDGEIKSILRIGPNLYNALLHLRYHPKVNPNPRKLWVDRVCIDHEDLQERASQVLLMRSIYRRCQRTLMWLGQEDTKFHRECL